MPVEPVVPEDKRAREAISRVRGLRHREDELRVLGRPFPEAKLPQVLQEARRTWTDRGPPAVALHWMDNDQADAFVRTAFPAYLYDYRALRPGAFKADLWRLLVLLKHGGLYADSGVHIIGDVAAMQDFWDAFARCALLIVHDDNPMPTSVFQGVIGARAGHPLIEAAVLHIVDNIRKRKYGASPLHITGPCAVGIAMAAALRDMGSLYNVTSPHTGKWILGEHAVPVIGPMCILRYHRRLVMDARMRPLFDTKVPRYYQTVYGAPQAHYIHMWRMHKAYTTSNTTPAATAAPYS